MYMLSPKQASYINLGLQDSSKGIYYWRGITMCFVYIDNAKLKSRPVYCIKFENNERAKYFAEDYIDYYECCFELFVYKERVNIKGLGSSGQLEINCGENEEMAKKLVKSLRTQYVESLIVEKREKKSAKKDFRGMKF